MSKQYSAIEAYRNGSLYGKLKSLTHIIIDEQSSHSYDDGDHYTQNVADYYNDDEMQQNKDPHGYYSHPVDDHYNYDRPNEPYDYPDPAAPKNYGKGVEEIKENGAEEEEKIEEQSEPMPTDEANMTRPIIEYDPNAKIKVSDPENTSTGIGGHTEYKLKGKDTDGEFDFNRRYKEFYALRNILTKNWPGFYIPAIPPKVKIGKMEDDVVQERCYLFNRFMKDISEIPYLWGSDEVKVFLRPNMSVAQAMSLVPAPTPEQLYEKLLKATQINPDIDDSKASRYSDSIRDFVINSKDIFPLLGKFKVCITQLEKQRCYQLQAYKHFADFLTQYENTTLNIYASEALQGPQKMFSDTDNNTMKEQIDNLSRKVGNPFIRFKYWVKEEIIDLHALLEAIGHKNSLESRKHKLEKQIKNSNIELEKLNSGKKTLKTIFKSQAGKANTITNLTTFIAQAEKDVEFFEKLIKLVTVNLYEIVIPEFKARKVKGYIMSLKDFSDSESKNSNELYRCWSSVLEQIMKAFEQ